MGDSFPTTRYQDLLFSEDTIVAVATPPGRGAIAIVRLSGPAAHAILDQLFLPGGKKKRPVQPRTMTYGWLQDGDELIDEAEACFYPSPRSYTGEHVVEFFVHGSPAILRRLIEAVLARGARAAEPGEFTLRAFRNGRRDLARAEAVNDLVRAETDIARQLALRALRGGLHDVVSAIRQDLQSILVTLETELEFEAQATEADAHAILRERLQPCIERLAQLVEASRRQQMHPRGVMTALCGKPNVGKSSLLNCILCRERAIVSAIPGTTRDTLEETVEIDRIPFLFVDTAGVFNASQEPDTLGVERTLKAVTESDFVVLLVDLADDLDDRDFDILGRLRRTHPPGALVFVANKSDLLSEQQLQPRIRALQQALSVPELLPLSAKVGTNVDRLLAALRRKADQSQLLTGGADVLINLRQSSVMRGALTALRHAKHSYESGETIDLVAEHLHRALPLVSRIDGETYDPDLLDMIFSQFCIGK